MRNSIIASALMIVPLLLAAVINYWPSTDMAGTISSVVVLPAKVFGAADLAYLGDAVSTAISRNLAGTGDLKVEIPPTVLEVERMNGDLNKLANAYQTSVLVITALTVDAGIFELDLQVIDSKTRRVIWKNAYQSPRNSYDEMIRAASDGLGRALRGAL